MAKSKEELRAYHREWQRNNRDKVKQYTDRYYRKRVTALLYEELEKQNAAKCSGGGQDEKNRE